MIAATMFSGIGAPEVAMPHWEWKWHAEIEKFPSAVMAHHHPDSTNLGDVSDPTFAERAAEIARPNVLVFGSPCQSFSVAGRRLGLDDPRGNLALVALGVIARLKPDWILFENVPGLLSSAEGSDFGIFLRTVDELGYSGAWAMLDSQYFGLAQRRERLFFVGHIGDWRGPAAVLFESESLCGNSPPRRAPGQRAAPTIESRSDAGGTGWGTDFLAGGGLAVGIGGNAETSHALAGKHQKRWDHTQETHVIENPEVAWALQERDHKGVDSDTKDGHLIIQEVADPLIAGEDKTYSLAGNNPRPRNVIPVLEASKTHAVAFAQNQRDEVREMPTAGALAKEPGVKQQTYIAFSVKDHGADAQEDLSPTLRAGGHDQSHANAGVMPAVAFQTRIARNGRGQPEDIVPALNGADAGATSDMRPCVAVAFKPSHYTRGKDGAPNEVCPPLTKETDKGDQDPLIASFTASDQANGFAWERPIYPTLSAQVPNDSSNLQTGVRIESAVRRLTPRECERLQGYRDDYTLIEYRGKPAADGPRYKALGNSMSVPVIRWILSRIESVDGVLRRG